MVAVEEGESPVVLVSCSPPFLLRRFRRFVTAHIPRRRRGAKFEVRWAAHVRGGSSGRRVGKFRGFLHPFTFVNVSAGRRRDRETGGGD